MQLSMPLADVGETKRNHIAKQSNDVTLLSLEKRDASPQIKKNMDPSGEFARKDKSAVKEKRENRIHLRQPLN
jgi:hypothetical protein